jgi:transposase-like protein
MKRSRFTEDRIIESLMNHWAAAAVAEVCRRHGMSSATFYAWKAKNDDVRAGGSAADWPAATSSPGSGDPEAELDRRHQLTEWSASFI